MKTKSIILGMGLMAFAAFSNAAVISGSNVQDTLDSLSAANGTVDAQNDQNSNDELWSLLQPSASTATFVASFWGNPSTTQNLSFGIYDAADHTNFVELEFSAITDSVTFSILGDGSVILNNSIDTGIDFASNLFGFYNTNEWNGSEYTGYSQESLNAGGTDAMLTYHNTAGFLGAGQSLLAFDPNLSGDYDDLFVIIESSVPVSEPGTLALLGLGLAGLGFSRRKAKS